MAANADSKAYAEGLLEASNDHAVTWRGLRQLTDVISHTPVLKQLLADAVTHPAADRARILQKVLADFDPLLRQFVGLLLEDEQLDQLPAIADQYERLFKAADNVVVVTVESPRKLSAVDRQAIIDRLAATGRRPLLQETVNRHLIGGLRLVIDDKEYDHSLSGALERVQDQLVTASL